MSQGQFTAPAPINAPVVSYPRGSAARIRLEAEVARQRREGFELRPRIGATRPATGREHPIACPHAHREVLGRAFFADAADTEAAIAAARAAKPEWAALPWTERAAVFLRAAGLLAGKYRDRINAATILGQSKTAHQAEIDAACELLDFWTFNVHYFERLMADQPLSPTGTWNRLEPRPLDGFVLAITPFNFTAIAGNLPTAPALCGNTVLWKPASTALPSAAVILEILDEAGLPPGVINLLPGSGSEIAGVALRSPEFGGLHFTGSTEVFQSVWETIGRNIRSYRQYPRLVGETGGKDFVVAHASADLEVLVAALVRGAFEYQGQKCSAASRAYIPSNLWPELRTRLADEIATIRVGDPCDAANFMGALIDGKSFARVRQAIDEARSRVGQGVVEVLGGHCDDTEGWFVHPTVIVVDDPRYRTMREELFGPVLSIYVYPEDAFAAVLEECDRGSDYALTGSILATDRRAIAAAIERLRFSAGNFYVNDKPTGAVVGQQPFGGGRASGTNDKAGSLWNLSRWVSFRAIKENFAPPRSWRYDFMDDPDAG